MTMTLTLGTWALTTAHAASSYDQPVLVHRPTGEAYGPGDIVALYPSYGLMPARLGVHRLASAKSLRDHPLVQRFCRATIEEATP